MCSYRNRSIEHNLCIETDLIISENKWTTQICDEKNQVGDCMLQMGKRCTEVLRRCGSMEGIKGFRIRYCLHLCLGPSDPEYIPLLRNLCPTSLLKKSWKERLQRIAWDFEKKMTKIWPWHMLLRKTGTCPLSHQNWQLDGSPNTTGNHCQAISLPRCVLIYTCISEAKIWDKCQCTPEYEFKGSRFF